MRVVIAGGSGQVGTVLARAFQRDGHEIVVLSRHPRPAPLVGFVRRGPGGACGDGKQYVSWIHHADFVCALRSAWGARIGLPGARWMLEIGAFFLRTETELMLKSRRVVPGVLLGNGFDFLHPTWLDAARSLCREWRDAS